MFSANRSHTIVLPSLNLLNFSRYAKPFMQRRCHGHGPHGRHGWIHTNVPAPIPSSLPGHAFARTSPRHDDGPRAHGPSGPAPARIPLWRIRRTHHGHPCQLSSTFSSLLFSNKRSLRMFHWWKEFKRLRFDVDWIPNSFCCCCCFFCSDDDVVKSDWMDYGLWNCRFCIGLSLCKKKKLFVNILIRELCYLIPVSSYKVFGLKIVLVIKIKQMFWQPRFRLEVSKQFHLLIGSIDVLFIEN